MTLKQFAAEHKLMCGTHPSYGRTALIPCERDSVIIVERGGNLVVGAFRGQPPDYIERSSAKIRPLGIDKITGKLSGYAVVFDPQDPEATAEVLRLARPRVRDEEDSGSDTPRDAQQGPDKIDRAPLKAAGDSKYVSEKNDPSANLSAPRRGRPRAENPSKGALRLRAKRGGR